MFEKNKLKKNTYFLDILRVMSCFAIVILHVNHNSILDAKNLTPEMYRIIQYIQSLLKWSVPMFFMISGYIFLGAKDECTYKSMAKHYIKMLLIIIFVFTGFNIIEIYMNTKNLDINTIINAFYLSMQGKTWDHMWFITSITIAYLIFPVIRPFYDKNDKNLDTFILLFGILSIVLPEINRVLKISLYTDFIFDYKLYYCFLGGYLAKKKIANNTMNNVTLIILLIILLVVSGYFYWNDKFNITLTSNYQRVMTFIETFLLFNIFANLFNIKNEKIEFLSKYTLLIYILHVAFVHLLTKVLKILPFEQEYPFIKSTLIVLAVFIISLIISILIKPIIDFIENKVFSLFGIKAVED